MREPVEPDEIFAFLLRIVRNEGKTVRIILMGSWKRAIVISNFSLVIFVVEKGAFAESTMRLHLPWLLLPPKTLRQHHRKYYFAGNPSQVRVGREKKSNKFCSNYKKSNRFALLLMETENRLLISWLFCDPFFLACCSAGVVAVH